MAKKFDDAIASCKKQMESCGIKIDNALLTGIAKSLGPSIYNRDSSVVAASSKGEMATIKKNFISKKLGVTDDDKAAAAIEYAIEAIGRSNRSKKRVVLYYLIAKHLKKASLFK